MLLREVYQLDDNNARLLLGARLKGKALQWFQSKSEYVEMTADALLDELASMFDHRPSRMELQRKFEERVWRSNENFSDYYHEKLILANSFFVHKEDLIDYLIDGIPDLSIRNQARI